MFAFTTHFNFEFKSGIRNKNLLLMNYLLPLGFYLMMGFILPGINPIFRETLIPAMHVQRPDREDAWDKGTSRASMFLKFRIEILSM